MANPAKRRITAIWLSAAFLLAVSGVAQVAIAGQYQYTAICTSGHGSLSGWTTRAHAEALGKKHQSLHAGHECAVRWR